MRFNFPFSWYNKFGTIPSTYKEAMSYEEQILWLCKHQQDLEDEFASFETTVSDLETLVNSFDSRINQNAIDIAGILDSIVTTISESSTDSQIPSAKSVYDFVTNYTPQGIITPLESTITLDSNLTLLNSGLYYTGNYVVRTTTGTLTEEYTLMVPQDTLFYYDSTHDTFTLLYNYLHNIGERWLNEYWYWEIDTSGVVPDTSHWQIVRYSATNSLSFPNDTKLPSSKAVVDYVSNYSQVFNEASLTNGAYFNLSVPSFVGTTISTPEVASNTSYVVFDLDEIKTTKFRVTGGCSNYVWFTTDTNPLDVLFSPSIATLSNADTSFTNEIVTITTSNDSHYVVFNFDNTDLTSPSVEVLETELDIAQLINSSSTEFEVPSAKAVYQAIQGGGGGTSDYSDLTNKPSINSVTLSGNKTTSDLFTAGTNISFSSNTISAPVNYSTTEKIVGTWKNGKPLYEKTFEITAPTVTTDGTEVQVSESIATNCNFAFIVSGFTQYHSSPFSVWSFPYFTNAGRSIKSLITTSYDEFKVVIASNGTAFNNCTCWVNVRYTKSTD